MNRARGARWLLAATLLLGPMGCARLAPEEGLPGEPRIWDVQGGRYVGRSDLVLRLTTARYRLLGEVHDNPAHHTLRAALIDAIGSNGKHPAVVFEQFDLAYDAALQQAQRNGADAEALANAGAFDRKGWRWPLHAPLLAAALRQGMPVHAGNMPRTALAPVMRSGELAGIDAAVQARLARAPWSERQSAALAEDIRESHCNKLPESLVPKLALAQRVRDAAMAEALARDATPDGAILIAGNGHVRRDMAVPVYLDAPRAEVLVVAWIEVDADAAQSASFPRDRADDWAGFDYVWLTRRVSRSDPCADVP